MLLGRRIHTRAYLCEVTKTIDSIPATKRIRWWLGGLGHIVPVLIVLGLLAGLRHKYISASYFDVVALAFATLWVFVGPCLIWYYEIYTLPIFNKEGQRLLTKKEQKIILKSAVYSNIYTNKICIAITAGWIGLVILGFSKSTDFLYRIGIRQAWGDDPFWWVVLFGTAIIAYYSSIGFCFSYKAMYLTTLVSRFNLDQKIYHEDGIFGLSFVGEFAFRTAIMFFSGWLFAPLIVLIGGHAGGSPYNMVLLLLGVYLLFTLLSFFVPVYIIHKKIKQEKKSHILPYVVAANSSQEKLQIEWTESEYKRLEFYVSLISRIRAMPDWPISLDIMVRFASASVVVPSIAGIVSAFLRK